MKHDAAYWIERLKLIEHPEGGFYRETYRAARSVPGDTKAYPGGRSFSTAIFYLLRSRDVSKLHRLRSDELFHFYAGAPFTLHVFRPEGGYERTVVGDDPDGGHELQAVVPAGSWFGATVEEPGAFSLVGCTVAPGFDFADFELADRDALTRLYPVRRDLIERLT